jgi:geranylgeranyl reductase family protein
MGLEALLIDKEVFPRYKPCGGALSERAASSLGFPLPREICEREITGARVHFKDHVIERHKSYRLTTLVTRSAFDALLLQKAEEAGAHAVLGERVEGFAERDGQIEVYTGAKTYESRFLVISAGYTSKLKDGIRGRDRKDQYGLCLVTDIEERDEAIDGRIRNALDIHFGVAGRGYGWIFPHRGYYSVGIGGLASRLSRPREAMLRFLKRNGFHGDFRLHGHPIPFGGERRRAASSRILLAGDSAGLVDPFSGEGLFYAVRSGQVASQVISERIGDEELDLPRAYEARCNSEFGDDLRHALILSRIMHCWPGVFLRLLASEEEILDKYMEIAASRSSYKGYVRWLLPRMPRHILYALMPLSAKKRG